MVAFAIESKPFGASSMLPIVTAALVILTVAVVIIKIAVRDDDVLNGRFFERSDREQR